MVAERQIRKLTNSKSKDSQLKTQHQPHSSLLKMFFRFTGILIVSSGLAVSAADLRGNASRELQFACNLEECDPGTRPVTIDFNDLDAGDYVTTQYRRRFGMTFDADTSNVSGGFDAFGPRLFDSSNPTGRDFDLGTPNQRCPGGGPGRGSGGRPARFGGENCVPRGNVMIIQENRATEPDDNRFGGQISIKFDEPTEILSVGFLDIQDALTTTTVQPDITLGNRVFGEGNNSFVDHRSCGLRDVLEFIVDFPQGGAMTDITICVPE